MPSNCSVCGRKGYDHVLDMTGVHYDLTNPYEEPIMRDLMDKEKRYALCVPCADAKKEKGIDARDYMSGKLPL